MYGLQQNKRFMLDNDAERTQLVSRRLLCTVDICMPLVTDNYTPPYICVAYNTLIGLALTVQPIRTKTWEPPSSSGRASDSFVTGSAGFLIRLSKLQSITA